MNVASILPELGIKLDISPGPPHLLAASVRPEFVALFRMVFPAPSKTYQASRMPLRLLSTTVVLSRVDAELGIRR
jgi:hypothetical protein